MIYHQINQFDHVKLRTTKNIKYMSAPPDMIPDPQGIWTVIGNIKKDLLVCKGDVVCRVPVSDVFIAGRSQADHLMEMFNDQRSEGQRSEDTTEV